MSGSRRPNGRCILKGDYRLSPRRWLELAVSSWVVLYRYGAPQLLRRFEPGEGALGLCAAATLLTGIFNSL